MAQSKAPFGGKHGFLWITLALFLASLAGHFTFAWFFHVEEAAQHGQQADVGAYLVETLKDVFENWQSEFMQLIWQVAALSFLWYVGSSQSKEGDERKEAKLDYLLEKAYGAKEANRIKAELKESYPEK